MVQTSSRIAQLLRLSALQRKMLRDLLRLRGQVLTIALVIAAGITSFVTMRGNYVSIEAARARFYDRQFFADIFVQLERAPLSLRETIERLPGVALIEARIVKPAMVPLPQLPEPVRASVVSLPVQQQLNQVYLLDGRLPEPEHTDEAVVLQSFAQAHRLRPGDRLPVVLSGQLRTVLLVGIGTSPEYVMARPPGSLTPDPARFVVLWMAHASLAAAFQMDGAFNDLSLSLRPGASVAGILHALDRLLAPHGGLGAYARNKQPSNQMIESELLQLSSMASLLPAIFLGVAALLLNLVLSRLVFVQQPEIASLKALGYSNTQIGLHFLGLVLVISGAGTLFGIVLGDLLGGAMVDLYRQYFKFPHLVFLFSLSDAALATAITFLAAAAGAFSALRRATSLPPAEAMRPPAPAHYRRSLIDRLGLRRVIGPSAHMVVRELERRPLRTLLSSMAIAAATALTVIGGWYFDAMDVVFASQFHEIMREDTAVSFVKVRPARAVRELAHLPGVLSAEGVRMVPVRFHVAQRSREGVLWGYPDETEMRRPRNAFGREVALPPQGALLTSTLARVLQVAPGENVEVEVLEGARQRAPLAVAGLLDEPMGLAGHLRGDALASWLGEPPQVSLALLRVDPAQQEKVDQRIKDLPWVLEVSKRSNILRLFREQSGNMVLTMAAIIWLFAATITVGVVYNNARVALALRGRDLASLRVLGFTRGEISAILIGEQLVQVLAALPVGLIMGNGLVHLLAMTIDAETYRMPVIMTMRSYGIGAAVTLIAAFFSALLVRRRLDHLDLVAVLKTRE